jgi:hypothetical protein
MADTRIEIQKMEVRNMIHKTLMFELPKMPNGALFSQLIIELTRNYPVSDRFVKKFVEDYYIIPGVIRKEGDYLFNDNKTKVQEVAEELKKDETTLYINE